MNALTEQGILKALEDLPEDAEILDAVERLVFLWKIGRGLQQVRAGEGIPHEEAKARMAKWLSQRSSDSTDTSGIG